MKQTVTFSFFVALTLSTGVTFADEKMGDMKGMDMGKPSAVTMKTHKAVGIVKALDAKAGTVTFAHEPVKTLNWPAMSMNFSIHDKALFDRLAEGRKVEFEFVQEGKAYVVKAVK